MATAIRTVGHDQRLSVVDHLEELRSRLIISLIALALVFGVCLWQNHGLLHLINRPLDHQTQKQVARGEGPLGQTWLAQQGVLSVAKDTQALARTLSEPSSGLPAATRAALAAEIPRLRADVARIPRSPMGNKPVTLGPGESFTTTLTVTLYFSLVLALPFILFELYGFVLPAFNPRERRAVMPLLVAIPFLFAAGVAFGYLVVLPAAVRFLQNFNSSQFNVLVQASQYYKFAGTILLAMGLSFQAPVAILGAVQADLVTPRQLRRSRRYAILVCAAIAAFLPGDAITLILETVPLYLLYEVSILVATVLVRSRTARAADDGEKRSSDGPPPSAGTPLGGPGPRGPAPTVDRALTEQTNPSSTVQDMIDHIDPELSS